MRAHRLLTGLAALGLFAVPTAAHADGPDRRVLEAQARRIAVIEKVKPTVVAIFSPGGQGGGSGVLIDRDGYALTNFHVVQGSGPTMHCGLADGVLYDAVLVGLDRVGDIALIKLVPKADGKPFPFAPLGDSDKVKAGDWCLAMGNPFLLATDFTPTVTYGLVSGVHRYQYPESSRGMLEYTDCIQVDTSINPGNSGGPLFNMDGELVGINGRISIEKRGRVNSGVGYAISINQIKNFLGHLRAGLDTDHATLGAMIENKNDDGAQAGMFVTRVLENSDAHRRGLEVGDELVSFAGRSVLNQNEYQNVLGIFPKGWRVPLVYRRDNEKFPILVRLMGALRHELTEDGRPKPLEPDEAPRRLPPAPEAKRPDSKSPAVKFFEAKDGYANYYFNRKERDRLWAGFVKHGDFKSLGGEWILEGEFDINQKKTVARVTVTDDKDPTGKGTRTLSILSLGGVVFRVEPLRAGQDPEDLLAPKGSGGLLTALYHYKRLLGQGEKGFEGRFAHGGHEPFYPMPADPAKIPSNLAALRVDTEVLTTEHAGVPAKWYFSLKDQTLLGAEVTVSPEGDPCELSFSDYKPVDGRLLPHRIEVRYGNGLFGVLSVSSYRLAAAR